MNIRNCHQELSQERECSTTVYIACKHGLHLRPAGRLVQMANSYEARITLICGNKQADAASVLDILSLTAGQGSCLSILAEGTDAEKAVQNMATVLCSDEL